jgi:hypothetical protein
MTNLIDDDWTPDRSKLKDVNGNPLTLSLFLEFNYNSYAMYNLKDEDWEHKGKIYPSLKRLFLEMEDPMEYDFATKYLLGWKHWQRMYNNKKIAPYIDEWRNELNLKLQSAGVRQMIEMALGEDPSYQATKYLADKGWTKKDVGRPKKQAPVSKEDQHFHNNVAEDLKRLEKIDEEPGRVVKPS